MPGPLPRGQVAVMITESAPTSDQARCAAAAAWRETESGRKGQRGTGRDRERGEQSGYPCLPTISASLLQEKKLLTVARKRLHLPRRRRHSFLLGSLMLFLLRLPLRLGGAAR